MLDISLPDHGLGVPHLVSHVPDGQPHPLLVGHVGARAVDRPPAVERGLPRLQLHPDPLAGQTVQLGPRDELLQGQQVPLISRLGLVGQLLRLRAEFSTAQQRSRKYFKTLKLSTNESEAIYELNQ